jgi:hypothetical protein
MKICSRCLVAKPLENFHKQGRASWCKPCQSAYLKAWRVSDKGDAYKSRRRAAYHSEGGQRLQRETWERMKHIQGPKNNERRKTEAARSKAKVQRKKWRSIPGNREARNTRASVRYALISGSSPTAERLVGCSISQLKKHFEEQFKEGMSWENYGKWHVDHIVPCIRFDTSTEDGLLQAFHYTNLQPLWDHENREKGTK